MKKIIEDDFSIMEAVQIEKLKEIVAQTLKEEVLIMDRLAHPTKEKLNKGQSISDKVAKFGGSWKFIILFALSISSCLFSAVAINIPLVSCKMYTIGEGN